MLYLIDGYNLLHAMGLLGGRLGPRGLERARARLLGLLHGSYGDGAANVTVAFDARDGPANLSREQEFHGIHVLFAERHEEADDLIERLIRQASAPKKLTVVSDDHRIQKAGRRRHCLIRGCQEYLEELDRIRHRKRIQQTDGPAPKREPSAEEISRWLDAFADIDQSQEAKELFDPFGFNLEDK